MLQKKPKGSLLEDSLLRGETAVFILLRPSTDWMKSTHCMEGNLLSSESTNLNVHLFQNTLTEVLRIMSDQIPGHSGPAKLTHKLNHHTLLD